MSIVTNDEKYLRQKSVLTSPRECEVKHIFEHLEEELGNSKIKGMGLSAIQVGEPIKACIVKFEDNSILHLINPEIVKKEEQIQFHREGCLSFPEIYINTNRYNHCVVKWLNKKGEEKRASFDGVESITLQHEIDHLEGILFFDRQLKPYKREKPKVGRNEKCPCGSGKKYKKCCGKSIKSI